MPTHVVASSGFLNRGFAMNTENSGNNSKRGAHLGPYRFRPGISGNPGGRPRKKPISDIYLAMINTVDPEDRQGRTYGQLMALGMFRAAISGKADAAKEIAGRVEGPVTGETEIAPATFVVNFHRRTEKRRNRRREQPESGQR